MLSSESIIRGVFEGRLGVTAQSDADAELLREFEQQCRPNPERARALEEARRRRGELLPRDAWPHLSLIGCWLGGTAGAFAERLRGPYGDVPLERLARAIDAELSSLNPEYQTKRASARLGPLNALRMKPGWSRRLQAADVARGSRDAQYKWPFVRHEWDELSRSEVAEDERYLA